MLNWLPDNWRQIVLNVASGIALVIGAAWLSYNLFAARQAMETAPHIVINSITVERGRPN